MPGRPAIIALFALLLASCAGQTPANPDTETGTGATLEVKPEVPEQEDTADNILRQEAEEAAQEAYAKVEDALLLSYQNAERVRDVMLALIPDLDPAFREPMEAAIAAFSDEVAEFGDLVDIAQGRPLTSAEQTRVMELSATIEEGMETFAQIVEMIP